MTPSRSEHSVADRAEVRVPTNERIRMENTPLKYFRLMMG
jgi:hypothetical protein